MKHILLLFLILISGTSFSQFSNSIGKSSQPLMRACDYNPRFDVKKSFEIYPEIQFVRSPVIGVSASYAHIKNVEWTSFNRGMNLGFEFDPTQDFYGVKASFWGDVFAMFIGVNAGLNMMYYRQVNR